MFIVLLHGCGKVFGVGRKLTMRNKFNRINGTKEYVILALSAGKALPGLCVSRTNMFWPTLGRLDRIGISSSARVVFGPMPDTISNCGERN